MVLGLSLVPLPTTTGTASITVPMVTMQATASGPSAVSGVVQVIQRNRVTKRHGKVIRVKPNQLPQPAITGTAAITVPMVTVRIEARPTDRAGRVQIIPRQKRQRRHGLVIQLSPAPMQAGVLTGTASITVPMVTMTASSSLSVTQGVTTIVQRPAPKLHRGRILYLKTRRAQTVVITGTASITVPMVTVFASTQSTIVATASITVPMVSLAGTATVLVTGIGAVSVPMVTLAASDSNSVVATAAVPVPMTTMLAHGLVFDLDGSLLGPGPTEGQLFPR